jgi:hypothetical protein
MMAHLIDLTLAAALLSLLLLTPLAARPAARCS